MLSLSEFVDGHWKVVQYYKQELSNTSFEIHEESQRMWNEF